MVQEKNVDMKETLWWLEMTLKTSQDKIIMESLFKNNRQLIKRLKAKRVKKVFLK